MLKKERSIKYAKKEAWKRGKDKINNNRSMEEYINKLKKKRRERRRNRWEHRHRDGKRESSFYGITRRN